MISTPSYAQDITTGLVGHWKLDETTGTTVIDYASNNITGSMANGLDASADSLDGRIDSGLVFDGIGHRIDLGNDNALSFDDNTTISAWIYPYSWGEFNAGQDYGTIFDRRDGGGTGVYWAITNGAGGSSNGMFAWYSGIPDSPQTTVDAIKLNQWQHVVLSIDNDVATFYVNGANVTEPGDDTINLQASPGTNAYIGSTGGASQSFDGIIDDVRIYSRALTAEDIAELYSRWDGHIRYNMDFRVPEYFASGDWIAMSQTPISDRGLVGHWKLDDATFGDAIDSSGLGNDGTTNGGLFYGSSGQIAYSMEFDGVDDFIDVPNNGNLENFSALTITAWINPDGQGQDAGSRVLSKSDAGAGDNYALIYGDDAAPAFKPWFRIETDGDNQTNIVADNVIPTGEWTHAAGVWDGSFMYLYVNGAEAATPVAKSGVLDADGNDLTIGSHLNSPANRRFDGEIDDVRLYNRALSASEINALYNYGTRFDNTWSQVGADLNIIGVNDQVSITALDGETIAFFDIGNDDLRTYSWDGANWSQIGSDLNIAGAGSGISITALSSNTIAYHDGANQELRTYEFDGSNWSQVGSGLPIAAGIYADIAALDENTIAYHDFTNQDLRTYSWDGTNWSQAGNEYNFAPSINIAHLTALNSSTIAIAASGYLYTYSWDGTDWAQVGNRKYTDGADIPVTKLHDNVIAMWKHWGIVNIRNLEAWRWDGNDWLRYSSSLYFSGGGGQGDVTALNSSTIAFIDGNNDDLRTYRLNHCTAPVRREGIIVYNADANVLQYCDGEDWRAMGPVPGSGGAGCSNPAGTAGDIVYNNASDWMQYCDGANWMQLGLRGATAPTAGLLAYYKLDETSGTNIADATGNHPGTTVTDTSLFVAGDAALGSALYITDINETITVNDDPALSSLGAFTLSLWYKHRLAGTANDPFISKGDSSSNREYRFRYIDGADNLNCHMSTDGTNELGGSLAYALTADWTHLACTWDGDFIRIYVNGELLGGPYAASGTMHDAGVDLAIGAYSDGLIDVSHGSHDEVRIYNRALYPNEIRDLYRATGGN
jgi:hypothetical protein